MFKLIIFAFISSFVFFQDLFLLHKINIRGEFFTTDQFENVYVVRNDELTKYTSNGQKLATFSNKVLGKISFVDAGNAMKTLLFYEDMGQILFLDNTLTQQSDPVALSTLGYQNASLVAYSFSNGFWIYDPLSFELIRFDQNLEKSHATGNLYQLLGRPLKPNFLTEANNKVYLNDPAEGILVFDIYGTYLKTIPFKGLSSLQVIQQVLYYSGESSIIRFDMKTLEQDSLKTDSPFLSARIANTKFFLLKEGGVEIYKIKK